MRWIGVALVLCSLGQLGTPKQSPGSADNLATPLKLDPVLRRALLRALTQLELEAQRKASAGGIPEPSDDEDPPVDPEQEANIKRDLEELLGNYERDSRKSEQSVEKMDVIVMDGEQPEQADVSVFDYEAPAEQDPETQRSTNEQPIDIQYNIIPSNSRSSNQRPQDSNAVATSVDKSVSDALKLNLDGQEVSIFQAPLVAAFTLQQDEKGNPRRVVPLIRRPQPIVAQQQQRLQQQSQRQQQTQLQQQQSQLQQQSQRQQQQPQLQQQQPQLQQQSQLQQQAQLQQQQTQLQQQQSQLQQQQTRLQEQPQRVAEQQLSREQELERRTRLLEEQLRQLQQQYQQQQLLKQQEIERERLRLFQEQQRQRFQFQFLPVEQTPPPPPPVRAQRQETGTAIVDFQHFRPQHNNNIFHQDPNHVNSQLQNLLYQSGVATPQEDLNIVSKVLSLNHEGRIHRPHRETLEGIVPPSRVIAPPFP